jgi:hypothetical protein
VSERTCGFSPSKPDAWYQRSRRSRGAAADHPVAGLRVFVDARGDLAHDSAPLSRCQARVGSFSNQRIATECDGFGGIDCHRELLDQDWTGTGGIKGAPPSPGQGGLLVVASSSPPVTRLAN